MTAEYKKIAKDMGFTNAGIMEVEKLIIVPEYRRYCEENICGKYGKVNCPPDIGTVDELKKIISGYKKALVLQTEVSVGYMNMTDCYEIYKARVNDMTERIMCIMEKYEKGQLLMISAGPWKTSACVSAYCIDCQKMAESLGMKCWANDGKMRLFSLILY